MNVLYKSAAAIAILVVTTIHTGCCSSCGKPFCFDRCADIPAGAVPPPLGVYNCGWQNVHTSAADRHKLTVYQSEWKGDSAELGPYGMRHVTELGPRMAQLGQPVTIETSGNVELDHQRQASIANHLTAAGFESDGEWVVVGYAEAEGAYGIEAPRNAASYVSGGGQSNSGGNLFGGNLGRRSTVGSSY